ncbi:MAG: hypothetical protein ACK4Z0_01430 [Sphingomonadaceae bacterium]
MSKVATNSHPQEVTELLLDSMFRARHPDRLPHQFMFNRPGEALFAGRMGTEVNYDHRLLLRTALYLRKHGDPHLRSLSIDKLASELTDILAAHYYLLASETFLASFDDSYAAHVSPATKVSIAAAVAKSSLFVEPRETTLFPLVPIRIEQPFATDKFFLVAPGELPGQLNEALPPRDLAPDSFPPLTTWDGRRETPAAWLGVRAPNFDAARQIRAAVLGAVALLPHHLERYSFSCRAMFGGYATLSDRCSLAFGDPHTPALMSDLVIGAADHPWLSVLGHKLTSQARVDKRQLRALEYFYRAWAPDPVRRFPTLFAAIDAIFGDAGAATQSVVDAVGPVMGTDYTHDRIRLMLSLRAIVIHGGAPNVYESSKYEKYYERYGTDATEDLELIVARCLQVVIFPGVLTERPHTYRDLILRETRRAV